MSKKKPDHIVFNEETGEYDANKKAYPTTVSAPSFSPVIFDNHESVKASKYFQTKFDEIKNEYLDLINHWENTKRVYDAACNFKPITGEIYHLYTKESGDFLSLIEPSQWKQKYVGSFKLTTDGKWEIIKETNDKN
tara:strand:+ start:366 stop:773 length:408 start_codon:yes stop_codon:yes gene_type:complete